MDLKALTCPKCGANLDVEDGIDMFYCKYCGTKIILDGQSEAAYVAKVRVKHMEHKERLQDKRNAQERYRMEFKQKDEKRTWLIYCVFMIAILAIVSIVMLLGNTGAKRQERELQSIVNQIMIDIENHDFSSAYVKANMLYWDDSWTSEGEDKWDATRKEIIKQIKAAEKKAGKTAESSSVEDGGFWDWIK